jgi:hypothetical protein
MKDGFGGVVDEWMVSAGVERVWVVDRGVSDEIWQCVAEKIR